MTLAQIDALVRVHNAARRRRAAIEDAGRPVPMSQWASLVTDRGE